jgi:hypothetical protein
MSQESNELLKTIEHIEEKLGLFYGFSPLSTAGSHLVSKEDLVRHFGEAVTQLPEFKSRAGVYVYTEKSSEDFFIGLHVDERIQVRINSDTPLRSVTRENLDSFWVIIEEVSHFHLLLNRAEQNRGVSKLELEWQGEIDKLLVTALTLTDQQGDPCLRDLVDLLHGSAIISAHEKLEQLYLEANRYAARFWHKTMRKNQPLDLETRRLLRQIYRDSWPGKISKLL